MNKQEAIKKIDRTLSLPRPIISFPYNYEDGLRYAKGIISQIDEPEKPVIPQFVADWIEECKKQRRSLRDSISKSAPFAVASWLMHFGERYNYKNQDIFARAWLDGYEVEKEKLYTARLKLVTQNEKGYLNKNCNDNDFFIDDLRTYSGDYQTSFTRSELEGLDIWDNPAFEIKEATNE